jgi:hypothetical protein
VGKTERGEEARDAPLRLLIPLYPEVLILQVLFACAYDSISGARILKFHQIELFCRQIFKIQGDFFSKKI